MEVTEDNIPQIIAEADDFLHKNLKANIVDVDTAFAHIENLLNVIDFILDES